MIIFPAIVVRADTDQWFTRQSTAVYSFRRNCTWYTTAVKSVIEFTGRTARRLVVMVRRQQQSLKSYTNRASMSLFQNISGKNSKT